MLLYECVISQLRVRIDICIKYTCLYIRQCRCQKIMYGIHIWCPDVCVYVCVCVSVYVHHHMARGIHIWCPHVRVYVYMCVRAYPYTTVYLCV